MRYDVITVGGATEDINFFTNDGVLLDNKDDILRQKLMAFEYGAKIKINSSYASFGGGAANAAVSFSKLGFKAACLIAIGADDRGKRLVKNLKAQKVKTELVQIIKDSETGYSFILVGPNNEHIVFSNRAANSQLSIGDKECGSLKNTGWIYITSLSGKWEQTLKKIFSVNGPKIAWNPGHIQLNEGMKKLAPYFKKTTALCLNKDEAIELASSDPRNSGKTKEWFLNINNLLTALKEAGPKFIVITGGKDGADAFDGTKFYHQEILKEKKRIDTTGVGDAFNSTFVAGLELFEGDSQKALKAGAKNTASVIGLRGAQNGLLSLKSIKS